MHWGVSSCKRGIPVGGKTCREVAVGMRDLTLVEAFLSSWPQVFRDLASVVVFCSPWGKGRLVLGSEVKRVACISINNDALLLRPVRFPPLAFLVVDFLTPIPSGCFLTSSSSPFPGFAL